MKFEIILKLEAETGSPPEVKITAPPELNKLAIVQWCLFSAMSLMALIEEETKTGKIIIPKINGEINYGKK